MSTTNDELTQLRRAAALLRNIQWAAKLVNPRTNFRTDTCPACRGIMPGTFGVVATSTGHEPKCELASILKEIEAI